MATPAQWLEGSRPRTWPAAFAPVLAGVGVAIWQTGFAAGPVIVRGLLALGVALALQIGVNYANDYSDGIRGTDDDRVGPFRLTGSGAAPARQVKLAAFAALGAGGVLGLILIAIIGAWWLLIIGILAIAAAWFYTGGKKPYGYMGLGEIFVFVFFGLVAVLGTAFAISGALTWPAVLVAIAIGLLADAVLVTNNLRDIPGDTESGKHTLAVRLGDQRTRVLYAVCIIAPFALMIPIIAGHRPLLIVMLGALLAIRPLRTVMGDAQGRALIPVLGDTGRLELVFSVLVLIGFCL